MLSFLQKGPQDRPTGTAWKRGPITLGSVQVSERRRRSREFGRAVGLATGDRIVADMERFYRDGAWARKARSH